MEPIVYIYIFLFLLLVITYVLISPNLKKHPKSEK